MIHGNTYCARSSMSSRYFVSHPLYCALYRTLRKIRGEMLQVEIFPVRIRILSSIPEAWRMTPDRQRICSKCVDLFSLHIFCRCTCLRLRRSAPPCSILLRANILRCHTRHFTAQTFRDATRGTLQLGAQIIIPFFEVSPLWCLRVVTGGSVKAAVA